MFTMLRWFADFTNSDSKFFGRNSELIDDEIYKFDVILANAFKARQARTLADYLETSVMLSTFTKKESKNKPQRLDW